ncbi:oxysterol-binding protein [Plectosphaerella cucumerina]|uniref:Oxysterol-binding protein n=1 Tax=Plectosphaerella cucumerina TaxID=40658 RepID=A0A8K0TCR0_9PEZI|nr:oxysterol-binding protein [Plectosphaerella cucumerina]
MDAKSRSSRIKDLVKFLSSVQGDLANISAPPYFLAPYSVVEVGACWCQRPAIFSAPAFEADPAKRAYLVLRLVLSALRTKLYVAGSPQVSIKKPLNAFLGELFLASWTDEESKSTVRLVSEQVSHHPPITAMHLADEAHGVRADGYARVEMTFNGSVDIRQVGHAVIHVDKYDEDYLIPLTSVKVRGFLGGRLYPEVVDTYTIESSSGFTSEICFSGSSWFGGKKNAFRATTFRRDDPAKTPIYTTEGIWSEGWTATDARTGKVVEKFNLDAPENAPAPIDLLPLAQQDPWESRRAWKPLREGLLDGNFREAVAHKTELEQAQRDMRAREREQGLSPDDWEPRFFKSIPGTDHTVFHKIAEGTDWELHDDRTKGVWRVDESKINMQRPFRGSATPMGR